MMHRTPPQMFERCLFLLLSERDRETVVGDLGEVYADEKLPRLGRFRANVWYGWQVLSFVPYRFHSLRAPVPVLMSMCVFTGLCGVWLGAMDLRLRHPGYLGREWIAGAIVLQAVTTLLALRYPQRRALRRDALLGCAAIMFLASKAAWGVLHRAHFEGYVLLIALALAVQAVLTFTTLARPAAPEVLRAGSR